MFFSPRGVSEGGPRPAHSYEGEPGKAIQLYLNSDYFSLG